jgi:magnesium transporter
MRPTAGITFASDLLTSPVKRIFRSLDRRVGAPPGTMVYTGPERTEPISVHLLEYSEEVFREETLEAGADFVEIASRDPVTWVNVDGLSDLEIIRSMGEPFDLHPLVLEDVVNTGQRPKLEEYEEYFFVILRMLTLAGDSVGVRSEQVGIVFGQGFVLSFQERAGDVWEPVRERLRGKSGRIRSRGADYLAYALIDAVVDHYFHILETFAEETEELELQVLEDPTPETMRRIHSLRQEMLVVRRAVWPLRELTNGLTRNESGLVQESTQIFLRDVYDHTVQVIDTAETLRDVISGLMDLYMTSVSNRMNEIMKVLTVMASIFIPLTFLAGIYGMNFQVMPELRIPWAYPALLGVMVVMGVGMVVFFRRKGWL